MKFDGTDTYPVGILSATIQIRRALTIPELRGKRLGIIRHAIRVQRRYLTSQIRQHNWRAVRNSFNGYLAEHDGHPHNCGKGWTRKAAERRADRICAATNPTPANPQCDTARETDQPEETA